MNDGARFFFKKNGGANLGQMGQNRAQNKVFCYFLKFDSLVFLEIAYNDSLQQCLISNRSKFHEKKLGQNRSKSGPKLGFLPFSKFGP